MIFDSFIRSLVNLYRKLPFKFLRGLFLPLYQGYINLAEKLNREKIVIITVGGIKYKLDLNENIDSAIYYDGCFEPGVTKIINKEIGNGAVIFDVGANIGCHTLPMAKLVGEKGTIFAFEPMSFAFEKLKYNLSLNNFKNVVLEKIALSDHIGDNTVYFRSSWGLKGVGSKEESLKKENIKFTTLDEYILKNKLQKMDFLKIDVDGAEGKIIRGGGCYQ